MIFVWNTRLYSRDTIIENVNAAVLNVRCLAFIWHCLNPEHQYLFTQVTTYLDGSISRMLLLILPNLYTVKYEYMMIFIFFHINVCMTA